MDSRQPTGYIVHLENDHGVDLIPEGNDASVVDGVLTILKNTEVLAIYRAGSWKAIRRDKSVTRYIDKKLSPISIETIEASATPAEPETTVD